MAHDQEEAPRSHRLLSLGAVALLVTATAVAFGRVFSGHVATFKLIIAALLSLAVAAALERRSPVLAALASAAALWLALGLLVFPHSMWHGVVPLGKTFHRVGEALGRVGEQTRVQVAPTEPLRPLLMAAVTAVWTATFSTHALAIRSGSPLLAAIPCAALLAFAGVVIGDGPRRGYAAFFLLALFAVLFADGLRRVRQFGPLRPWTGVARPRVMSTTTTRGARRVGLAALGIALLIPGILPGFESKPLLDQIANAGRGSIDPLVSVTSSLQREGVVDLFTVKSDVPSYWRWLALDRFDGDRWTTDDIDLEHAPQMTPGAQLPAPEPFQSAIGIHTRTVEQTVRIMNPPGKWLPLAFAPTEIDTAAGAVRYSAEKGAAVPVEGVHPGTTYHVTSSIILPSFKTLNHQYDFSGLDRYTQLPRNLLDRVRPLAERITRGAGTPLEKAVAIQDFFRSEFTYDATVSGQYDIRTLMRFLRVTKTGFCQQFATGMTVMLRSLGLPARPVVGFAPGEYDPTTDTYLVRTTDAHVWVEMLFPGVGWLPFEPTPIRDNPVTDHISEPSGNGEPPGFIDRDPERTRTGGDIPVGPRTPPAGSDPSNDEAGATPDRGAVWIALAVVAGILVLAVAIPLVKTVRRRLRVRRAGSSRELVLAAYEVFTSRAADLGLARKPGETIEEYRRRLHREVAFSDGHVDRLSRLTRVAAYAPARIGARDAEDAEDASRTAIAELRRAVPVRRRVLGVFRPSLWS